MRLLQEFLRWSLEPNLHHWELREQGFDDDTIMVGVDMGWLRLVAGRLGFYTIDPGSVS